MHWQVLMVLQSVLNGYRLIVTRQIGLSKKDASLYALIVSFICVWTTGILVALYKGNQLDFNAVYKNIFFIVAGGFLFGFANLLSLRMMRLVNASVAAILTLLNNIAVLIIATVFGGERLSRVQIVGALLMLLAIGVAEGVNYLSKKNRRSEARLTVKTSLVITIVLSIVFALGVMNEKRLLQELPLTTYLVFGWGAQFMASAVLFIGLNGKRRLSFTPSIHKKVWVSGMLLAITGLLFVVSLAHSNSSTQATFASSFKLIVAMILSYILLKERSNILLKILSMSLSVVGLVLLLD